MKISCNIIQDLMPSYMDGILSDDSKQLLDTHLASCENCQKKIQAMEALTAEGKEKDKKLHTDDLNALRKIKRKLRMKKIGISILSVVIVLFIVLETGSYLYTKESYWSLEESGLQVENKQLSSDKNLVNRIKIYISEDEKTEFICAIDSKAAGTSDLKGKTMLVQDLTKKEDSLPEDDGILSSIEKIYYLSETAYQTEKKILELAKDETNSSEIQKLEKEMEESSRLLWSTE